MTILLLSFYLGACSSEQEPLQKTIIIQPFQEITTDEINQLSIGIREYYPKVDIANKRALPASTYNTERKRYRADLLINELKSQLTKDEIVIGVTSKDISTSLKDKKDWGVMGLAFCPGSSCVVSTFRLNPKNISEQLLKTSLHELGHTQGLEHCETNGCFMRDAEGRNITDQLHHFCTRCSNKLKKYGWTTIEKRLNDY